MTAFDELHRTALALTTRGKGILAADESTGTIEKRLKSIGVQCTEENRRAYRDLLFSTKGLSEFISGVILFDETLRQKDAGGTPFAEGLAANGIIPGIKVDKGTVDLPGHPGEKVTQGLDGLAARFDEYRELGARFAKWRAVLSISDDLPSAHAIEVNAHALARYAAICQAQGLVPIVEPEVLMDGAHTLTRCAQVTEAVLQAVFDALHAHGVVLERMLLKPNMVVSGTECPQQAPAAEVAAATLTCLRRTVPAAVPGIMFLSGGQTDETATENLNAINAADGAKPWALSFSYGRALQAPVLKAWRGEVANVAAAQQALLKRARLNGAAQQGTYHSPPNGKTAT
ncbi:MAG: fructose-bisphosphate aldolase class I [Xanthomonadaceae bacterium]|nr:fructose-bisphosphate aldolase class I [Xanthomonadaceae bacterium]